MLTPRNAVYAFAAACVLAVIACQPESPAERVGKDIDRAAKKLGEQVDKTADKPKEAASDARK